MSIHESHKQFIEEFNKFLKLTAIDGSILTTTIIKYWIRNLDATHPLKISYVEFLLNTSRDINKIGFDSMVNHMKFLTGYYQVIAYTRRVGFGTSVKVINVMKNKIKI